jgi:hypothetical protein
LSSTSQTTRFLAATAAASKYHSLLDSEDVLRPVGVLVTGGSFDMLAGIASDMALWPIPSLDKEILAVDDFFADNTLSTPADAASACHACLCRQPQLFLLLLCVVNAVAPRTTIASPGCHFFRSHHAIRMLEATHRQHDFQSALSRPPVRIGACASGAADSPPIPTGRPVVTRNKCCSQNRQRSSMTIQIVKA